MRRTLSAFIELAIPFVAVAVAWQAFSLFGPFPQKLFPGVEAIIATFARIYIFNLLRVNSPQLTA
jgi:ABC-type nitrate/sulfonate/bicarbonate transport system permease component